MLMHLFAFGLGYFYYFLFDSGKNNKKGGEWSSFFWLFLFIVW
jgi:hypothetical protein